MPNPDVHGRLCVCERECGCGCELERECECGCELTLTRTTTLALTPTHTTALALTSHTQMRVLLLHPTFAYVHTDLSTLTFIGLRIQTLPVMLVEF